jgi:hypothetical protein
MKTILLTILTALTLTASAQTAEIFNKKGDSSYYAKNYKLAAESYLKSAALAEFKPQNINTYYNAACCYALLGDKEQAFKYLQLSVDNGYNNIEHLKKDTDLDTLHTSPQWARFIAIKKRITSSSDPLKAKLITSDITNFWDAYDRAQKDTANRYGIYKKYYIDKGTVGLQDYFATKVYSIKNFVRGHDAKPKFYAAIRKNTLKVNEQKKQMQASFVKFKEYYPQAQFPDVYFVVGNFTSGGTSSSNGLLLGIDQECRTPDIPTGELNLWSKNNFSDLNLLPHIVAHELIHFQQDKLPRDTTLLRDVLVEGMADFLGELISGNSANLRLIQFAKGKEKTIWADFKKEIYLKRGYNWIANGNQETPDHPADLGYWVGYMICKAYYNNAADKKQAVHDILNIKDYRKFYQDSKVEEMIAGL